MKELVNRIVKKFFLFSSFCLIFFIAWSTVNHLENVTTITPFIHYLVKGWFILYKADFVGTSIAIIILLKAFGILMIACLMLWDIFSTTLSFFWEIYLIFRKWLRRNKKE